MFHLQRKRLAHPAGCHRHSHSSTAPWYITLILAEGSSRTCERLCNVDMADVQILSSSAAHCLTDGQDRQMRLHVVQSSHDRDRHRGLGRPSLSQASACSFPMWFGDFFSLTFLGIYFGSKEVRKLKGIVCPMSSCMASATLFSSSSLWLYNNTS